MLVSDVLRVKGHNVVKIHATDSVGLAVRRLAEHRIGALIVEDRWMKPVGIFSERDFINAAARDGAAVLSLQVQQLMSTRIISCRSSDRVDAVLATMTTARISVLLLTVAVPAAAALYDLSASTPRSGTHHPWPAM
jgi:CBS domain-containing protein